MAVFYTNRCRYPDKEEIPNPSHIIEINHTKNQAIVLIKANMRATRDEMNNKAVKKL